MSGKRVGRGSVAWAAAAAAALVTGGGMALAAGESLASSSPASITGGQTLTSGQSLESADGHYLLTMESDGVLSENLTGGGRSIWSTPTSGHSGARAVLQPAGDLVVEDASGDTLWSDNAPVSGGCPALNVLDDGNVEVDGPSSAAYATGNNDGMLDGDYLLGGQTLYADSYGYRLSMQSDGNLVEYDSANHVVWDTGTAGNPGAYLVLQAADGNLVLYSASNAALWSAGAAGHAGDHLIMQSDSDLVLYTASNDVIWHTNQGHGTAGAGSVQPLPRYGSSTPCPASTGTSTGTAPATTVTVPTTTTVTVASNTPPRTHERVLRIPVAFAWNWRGDFSYVERISFARVPADLRWTARISSARRGHGAEVIRAVDVRQRGRLLRRLESQRYRTGQEVTLTISRPGYLSQVATFRIRRHATPELIGAPTRPRTKTPPRTRRHGR